MTTPRKPQDARILAIDDEPANLALVEAVLKREGYRHFEALTDPRLAPERHLAFEPDLVLLDLMMPSIDGYALLDGLGRLTGEGDLVPIMVLTADTSVEAKRRALALGARDIVTKPFDVFEFALRVANLIELRMMFQRLGEHRPDVHGAGKPDLPT